MAFGHFSFGLSHFHDHSSWLMCEVALRSTTKETRKKQAILLYQEWKMIPKSIYIMV